MFRFAALVALVASTCSATVVEPGATIPVESTAGKRLLSKARLLNDAGDRDVTFVAQYDIKYTGCSSLVQINGEEGGNGGEEGLLYTQNLVKFSLCPSSGSCSKCEGGGEYVVSMRDFIDAYTEQKMNAQEQACENLRENVCYNCENANDDEACYNNCYAEQGMDYCIEYEGEEEFEIQRYIECAEMDEGNNDNNNGNYYYNGGGDNYYGQYFIGPYCSEKDGWSIYLGVFYDEGCTARGSADAYSSRNYGATLPFSSEPIVTSECISCQQVDEDQNNNNNGNQNNNYYYQEMEVSEFCGEVYEMSAKCEENMDVYYPDTSACDYVDNILPKMERATRNVSTGKSSGSSSTVVLAWVFAATTLALGSYAFFLYRKLSRGKIDLSGGDGQMA